MSQAREVHQYKAVSKSSLELKLQNNSHHLQDLKIEFLDKSGQSKCLHYLLPAILLIGVDRS